MSMVFCVQPMAAIVLDWTKIQIFACWMGLKKFGLLGLAAKQKLYTQKCKMRRQSSCKDQRLEKGIVGIAHSWESRSNLPLG